jgi:hypothetical protein
MLTIFDLDGAFTDGAFTDGAFTDGAFTDGAFAPIYLFCKKTDLFILTIYFATLFLICLSRYYVYEKTYYII